MPLPAPTPATVTSEMLTLPEGFTPAMSTAVGATRGTGACSAVEERQPAAPSANPSASTIRDAGRSAERLESMPRVLMVASRGRHADTRRKPYAGGAQAATLLTIDPGALPGVV